MGYYLDIIFDTNKYKCNKENLFKLIKSCGLEFRDIDDNCFFLVDKYVSFSIFCIFDFVNNEIKQQKGHYFDVLLAEEMDFDELDYVLCKLISIGNKIGFKIINSDIEINEKNYQEYISKIYNPVPYDMIIGGIPLRELKLFPQEFKNKDKGC